MTQVCYHNKQAGYFQHLRRDIISALPVNRAQKVLEIGAGECNTLLYLKQNSLAAEVMGFELMHKPGSYQENPLIDRMQFGDVEKENIDAPKNYFDTIICADVLEHLADPWKAIDKISSHLKQGGLLIASIPNIREWRTLTGLVFKKRFKYDPEGGIMDQTHLRFFCKQDMIALLSRNGMKAISCEPNFLLKVIPEGRKRRLFNKLSFGLFRDFLTVQYLVIAKKE